VGYEELIRRKLMEVEVEVVAKMSTGVERAGLSRCLLCSSVERGWPIRRRLRSTLVMSPC